MLGARELKKESELDRAKRSQQMPTRQNALCDIDDIARVTWVCCTHDSSGAGVHWNSAKWLSQLGLC